MLQDLKGGQRAYYAEVGWFKSEFEAECGAVQYLSDNLQVDIIWLDTGTNEFRFVKCLRMVSPGPNRPEVRKPPKPIDSKGAAWLNLILNSFVKLGHGIQLLFFFLFGSLGLIGGMGFTSEKALFIGVGIVVIFWLGYQMGKEAGKVEAT